MVSSDKGKKLTLFFCVELKDQWYWKGSRLCVTTHSDHVCSHLSFCLVTNSYRTSWIQHLIPDGPHCSHLGLWGNLKSKNLRIWKKFTTLILELTKVLYIFQTSYGNVSIWHTFWVLPQQYTRDTTGTSQI